MNHSHLLLIFLLNSKKKHYFQSSSFNIDGFSVMSVTLILQDFIWIYLLLNLGTQKYFLHSLMPSCNNNKLQFRLWISCLLVLVHVFFFNEDLFVCILKFSIHRYFVWRLYMSFLCSFFEFIIVDKKNKKTLHLRIIYFV